MKQIMNSNEYDYLLSVRLLTGSYFCEVVNLLMDRNKGEHNDGQYEILPAKLTPANSSRVKTTKRKQKMVYQSRAVA